MNYRSSRRLFLKNASFAGVAAAALPHAILNATPVFSPRERNNAHVFLFQGDSITDGNRGRNNDPNHIMGHGYAFSISSRAGAFFPTENLSFFNRGVSGNKISDLAERWEKDALSLKPDVLSILIGVNDTDAALKNPNEGAVEDFENTYRAILENTKKQIANCLIVLCEPFILPVGRVKQNQDAWEKEIKKRQQVVRRLSTEFKTVFVPLQSVFDSAARHPSADYWIWDGIHPTVAGHELITEEWLKQVSKPLPFLKKIII